MYSFIPISPTTSSSYVGLAVPMPTLPVFPLITNSVPEAMSAFLDIEKFRALVTPAYQSSEAFLKCTAAFVVPLLSILKLFAVDDERCNCTAGLVVPMPTF